MNFDRFGKGFWIPRERRFTSFRFGDSTLEMIAKSGFGEPKTTF
jgi:hypothetical protein